MYLGHSLLGFALAGAVASVLGIPRRRAVSFAALAAGFALVPDTDLAYTVYAVIEAGPTNVFPTTQYVWTESWVVHRALTHSLVVGSVAVGLVIAVASAITHRRRTGNASPTRLGLAATVLALLAAVGFTTDGGVGLLTMALYIVGAVGLAVLGVRRGVRTREIGLAAGIGLLTHPFGDVFMGTPPTFLYPLWTVPPIEVVTVSSDATVNLLALFALEIVLAWAALIAFANLTDRSIRSRVEPHAVMGIGFAGAAFLIQPPTLDIAYHFAVGVLGVGLFLGVVPTALRGERRVRQDPDTVLTTLATALAAASLAVVGYLVAYLIL